MKKLLSFSRPGAAALFALAATLLLFSAAAVQADANSPTYGDNPSAGDYAQTSDARIYYESYGAGKPVFVFHGGGAFGNSQDLAPVIDALRKSGFRVIAVSTRGSGFSEAGRSPLTFETKAKDMLAVMRKITSQPAPVFGFSDGGYIAYMLASLYPEAVDRVVTVGAGTVKPGYYPPSKVSVATIERHNPTSIKRLRKNMPQPERLEELINATLESWHKMDFSEKVLGAIKCPCLLIAGDEDGDAPILTMVEAHQLIPYSRLFIVPNASHGAFFNAPELVLPAISDFMKKDASSLHTSEKLPFNNLPNLWKEKLGR